MTKRFDLLRPADIAKLAGVDSSTVANWRRRHDDFPLPAQGTDRMFDRVAIVSWLQERGMLAGSDPIAALRASGLLDPEAFAFELAALGSVLGGVDGLGGDRAPDSLLEARQSSETAMDFDTFLAEAIALAERRWAGSGSTAVPLFPMLSAMEVDNDATALIGGLIDQFSGVDRWSVVSALLPQSVASFSSFVADTMPLPEKGHLVDLAAGSGDSVIEIGARRPALLLSAIAENEEDVRAIAHRAMIRGVTVRVLLGDLDTAGAACQDNAPNVILSSGLGRLGNSSVRKYSGGLLGEREYGLASLLAASQWLAPGGFASVVTDQRTVSDLPEYLRLARDQVFATGDVATIVALPEGYRESLPILWILEKGGNHGQVVMVDARRVSESGGELEQIKSAARYGWSFGYENDPDYVAWYDTEGASQPWTSDLIGATATVEPGYWAPTQAHSDWASYDNDYWIAAHHASRYVVSTRDSLAASPFRHLEAYDLGSKPAKVRLGVLAESEALTLDRGPAVDDPSSLHFEELFHELLKFESYPWKLEFPLDEPGIARTGDVVLAVRDGVIRAAVLEGGPMRVGRTMWIVRPDPDVIDSKFLAMTINSAWGERISRLVDRVARNDPRRIELALVDIEVQRELGAEYRRLTRLDAELKDLSRQTSEVLELFKGRAASGEVRVGDEWKGEE